MAKTLPGGLTRLSKRFDRYWRVVGTGIGFATAGFISLMMAAVAFPLLRLLPGTPEQNELRAQYALHLSFRFHVALIGWLGVMRLRTEDAALLAQPGILVVANHPTLIDALILMSHMPQADCVVKTGHYDNFWLATTIRGAGYIPNRNGPQVVEECSERLRRGRSVLIFPEGTRSPKNGLGRFSRGVAHIALKAGCDPVPVTIECEPPTLYHGLAWWQVPERRFTLTLSVDSPLPLDEIVPGSMPRPRAARAVTDALRNQIERRLLLVRDQCSSR